MVLFWFLPFAAVAFGCRAEVALAASQVTDSPLAGSKDYLSNFGSLPNPEAKVEVNQSTGDWRRSHGKHGNSLHTEERNIGQAIGIPIFLSASRPVEVDLPDVFSTLSFESDSHFPGLASPSSLPCGLFYTSQEYPDSASPDLDEQRLPTLLASAHGLHPPSISSNRILTPSQLAADVQQSQDDDDAASTSTATPAELEISSKPPDLFAFIIEISLFGFLSALAFHQGRYAYQRAVAHASSSFVISGSQARPSFLLTLASALLLRALFLFSGIFPWTLRGFYGQHPHIDFNGLRVWFHVIGRSLPSLVFLSAYFQITTFWAQIYYRSELIDVQFLRPVSLYVNAICVILFSVVAIFTLLVGAYRQFRGCAMFFLGVCWLIVALTWIYFGLRVVRRLYERSRITLQTERLRRSGLPGRMFVLCTFCPAAFALHGLYNILVSWGIITTYYPSSVNAFHWYWDACVYFIVEWVPSAIIVHLFWSRKTRLPLILTATNLDYSLMSVDDSDLVFGFGGMGDRQPLECNSALSMAHYHRLSDLDNQLPVNFTRHHGTSPKYSPPGQSVSSPETTVGSRDRTTARNASRFLRWCEFLLFNRDDPHNQPNSDGRIGTYTHNAVPSLSATGTSRSPPSAISPSPGSPIKESYQQINFGRSLKHSKMQGKAPGYHRDVYNAHHEHDARPPWTSDFLAAGERSLPQLLTYPDVAGGGAAVSANLGWHQATGNGVRGGVFGPSDEVAVTSDGGSEDISSMRPPFFVDRPR